MKSKRFSVILLAFAMLATVFTGCASNEDDDPDNGRMRISWVGWTTPTDRDGEIVALMEEKFGVNFYMIDTSDGTAFNVKIATGDVPDVFRVGFDTYKKFVNDEIIAEIPYDKIEKYAPDLYAAYNGQLERYMDWSMVDGKNYGLLVPNPESGEFRQLVAWRGDWLEKVGISKVPDTLAEMEDAMYKFTNNDPDGNGKKDTYGLSLSMMGSIFGAYGFIPNNWTRVDGKLIYGAVQPEMKEALAILAKWYKDGVIEPEFVRDENKGIGDWSVSTAFVTGLIGVSCYPEYLYWEPAGWPGGREGSNPSELRKNFPGADEKIVYGNPPAGPDGKRGLNMRDGLQHAFITFGKKVEEDEAKLQKILEVFNYACANEEGFMLTRFGVEGTHYEMQNDIPTPIGKYTQWREIVKAGGGATFNNAIWLPSFVEKVNAEYKWGISMPELRKDGIMNEIIIPLPSQSKVGTECQKIQDESFVKIITGVEPLDYFDTFVDKWRAAGGATLEEEASQR